MTDAKEFPLSRPTFLAILALPAGAIGYVVTTSILSGLALPEGIRALVLMIVPLFIAGLCMVPFILPLFDRMAKRDLAAYRAEQAAGSEQGEPTGDGSDARE